jgi:hypothetical protein
VQGVRWRWACHPPMLQLPPAATSLSLDHSLCHPHRPLRTNCPSISPCPWQLTYPGSQCLPTHHQPPPPPHTHTPPVPPLPTPPTHPSLTRGGHHQGRRHQRQQRQEPQAAGGQPRIVGAGEQAGAQAQQRLEQANGGAPGGPGGRGGVQGVQGVPLRGFSGREAGGASRGCRRSLPCAQQQQCMWQGIPSSLYSSHPCGGLPGPMQRVWLSKGRPLMRGNPPHPPHQQLTCH